MCGVDSTSNHARLCQQLNLAQCKLESLDVHSIHATLKYSTCVNGLLHPSHVARDNQLGLGVDAGL